MFDFCTVPPPNDVSVYPLPQPGTVRVTWTPPNTTHGLNVFGYTVQTDGGGEVKEQHFHTASVVGETSSVDVSGLQQGQGYHIRVAIMTTAGVGTFSDAVNVTTYAGEWNSSIFSVCVRSCCKALLYITLLLLDFHCV